MGLNIGLFGGTFDPIHNGHLNLALELMEKKGLDQIWIIPAQINPFKTQSPPTLMEHRLEMVRLAIKDLPQFHLKDLEKELPPPSYTIHTLRTFIAQQAYKQLPTQFFLLMGEDSIPGFFKWHLPEEIVKLVPLLIGSRSGIWSYELNDFSMSIREAIQKGLVQTRLMDISGTEIRYRFSVDLFCGHLIPDAVLQYIHKHKIYEK